MSAAMAIEAVYHDVADGAGRKATLAPISRCFQPGCFTVVGGPSGVGKTTLLSLLSLAVPAVGGEIRHGTDRLTGMAPARATAWRRRSLGMVFQTTRLIGVMTAREHIDLASRIRPGNRAATISRGLDLLDAFGLLDRLDHYPAQLSGGEKQRVAISQALCFDPPVVLADEPTAALDAANAELIGTMLSDYARQKNAVVICVSHDPMLRAFADDSFDLERP
jgi:putative ABC transport system ATP-binding protein